MGLDTTLPEHVLNKMSPEDRKTLGKAGQTKQEAETAFSDRLERHEHDELIKWLLLHDVQYSRSRMDRKDTRKVGTADFLINAMGRFVSIEMKAGKNKPDEDQIKWLNHTARTNGLAKVCYSAKEAIDFLRPLICA